MRKVALHLAHQFCDRFMADNGEAISVGLVLCRIFSTIGLFDFMNGTAPRPTAGGRPPRSGPPRNRPLPDKGPWLSPLRTFAKLSVRGPMEGMVARHISSRPGGIWSAAAKAGWWALTGWMGPWTGPPGRLRGGGTMGRRGMYSPIKDPGMAGSPVVVLLGPDSRDMLLAGGACPAGATDAGMDTPRPPLPGLRLELSSAREELLLLLGRSASGVDERSTFLKALATSE